MAQIPAAASQTDAKTATSNTSDAANERGFQALNDAYQLPVDSKEHSRLDMQHGIVKLMLEGEIYQQHKLVEAALSPTENHRRRILDVGSGSGRWAIEMAEKFPHADVLGIDLSLPNIVADPSGRVPPNCTFQIADANNDMNKLGTGFDMVHQRCVESGINDSDLFFYEAARILRPGGLLLLVAATPQLVDENGRIFPLQKPGDANYSYYQHMVACMLGAHLKAGPFRLWHPFWRSIFESNPSYSNINIEEVLVPIGPWPENMSDAQQKLAETMQDNHLRLWPTFGAIIIRNGGVSKEFANNLVEGGVSELRELPPVVHGYCKWVFATAMRNDKPWTARKEPWKVPPGVDVFENIVHLPEND